MNHKGMAFRNLYFAFLALLCFVAVSLAWFTSSNKSNMEGSSFRASAVENAQISLDNDEYGYSTSLDLAGSLTIIDVSGIGCKDSSGNVQLYTPRRNGYTGLPIENDDGSWDVSYASSSDYYEVSLYIKVNVDSNIQLTSSSYVSPVNVSQRISPEFAGGVSADYIAGAVRVSFCQVNDLTNEETLTAVWVPNKNYELSYDDDTQEWIMNTSGTPETDYTYYDGTQLVNAASLFHTELPITVGNTSPYTVGDYRLHLIIRIWAEGTDRETMSVLAGGLINTCFNFAASQTGN